MELTALFNGAPSSAKGRCIPTVCFLRVSFPRLDEFNRMSGISFRRSYGAEISRRLFELYYGTHTYIRVYGAYDILEIDFNKHEAVWEITRRS